MSQWKRIDPHPNERVQSAINDLEAWIQVHPNTDLRGRARTHFMNLFVVAFQGTIHYIKIKEFLQNCLKVRNVYRAEFTRDNSTNRGNGSPGLSSMDGKAYRKEYYKKLRIKQNLDFIRRNPHLKHRRLFTEDEVAAFGDYILFTFYLEYNQP